MKKLICLVTCMALFAFFNNHSSAQLVDKIRNKVKQKADQKADESVTKDKNEDPSKEKKGDAKTSDNENIKTESIKAEPASIKTYQNYDFIPGDKVLFEDSFIGEQDGEFPTHWELLKGQAVLNKVNSDLALFLTEGNYAEVKPRMKTEKYLTEPFTIEYDHYFVSGAYGVVTILHTYDKEGGYDRESQVYVNNSDAGFTGTISGVELSKSFPEEMRESFENKWHHVAMVFKNHQLKVYVDQNRILVVPDTKEDYENIIFGGIGDDKSPIIFKNVRIASGGEMNLIGKKFTETKIVTHGINFDYNKSTLKPESMGTLNMIVKVMQDNPTIKFEVGGHTDSDGDDNYNMKLSQQRADAVKTQLITMGIDASRLTSKGYGESKPIGDNNSQEGKANNRRVEFVKL